VNRSPLIVALLAASVLGAGCASSHANPAETGVVKVVAAENFWGDIVRQIGGAHVDVTSIIKDPTADPHEFESDARDATAVAEADVVVKNGAGYDDAIAKLLSTTTGHGRVVLSVDDVLQRTGDGVNPHFWYDLPNIPAVAAAIESTLARVDSPNRAAFATGEQRFVASLAPLNRVVTQIRMRYAGAPVAYTERVPAYLLDAAGLNVVSPPGFAQAIEDGNEPSAQDAQTMDDLISGRHVRALLYNAQATSPVTSHVRDLARAANVPVVAVTETMPTGAANFQAWQLAQLQDLLHALGVR
jgi:zinc/manganese transport system substrate-binding protein